MANLVDKFGSLINDLVYSNPQGALKLLTIVYDLVGKQAHYFPDKSLLPSRQYIASVAASSIVNSLRHPENSAIVSIFTPCEILHAMGIEPMFPEGLSCYLTSASSESPFIKIAEDNSVPESFCSFHKILIGLVESNVLPKPKFIINTTLACDANQLSFRRAAKYYKTPHFLIDIPNNSSTESIEYVTTQLKEMTSFIEKNSNLKLDEMKLKEAIGRSNRTIKNYKEYLKLRSTRYVSDTMTSEMLSAFATHVLLGTNEAEEYTKQLIDNMKILPEETHGVRLLWVHTLPNWQKSLNEILNTNKRCEIVACDMTFDSLYVEMDENTPYEAMAKRVLNCSFNGPSTRRIDLILKMAKEMNVDGIVYFCHWGCKQTIGSSQQAKTYFENSNFPTLVLDGDGCDSSNINDGQMVTRIEAFLEQLEDKK